jgi:hypothetical protein
MVELLRNWGEIVGLIVLLLLNVGKKLAGSEGDCDKRLREMERRQERLEEAGSNREKRLDQIGQKMSDIADDEQRFIGQAMDRFVSQRDCDRRHPRAS